MITRLGAPVPPMLEATIGYTGEARLVAFYWKSAGDEAVWDDGQRSLVGADWRAYLLDLRHPSVALALAPYFLGNGAMVARDWLLLDRQERSLAVGPVADVRSRLRGQWSPVTDRPSCDDWAVEDCVAFVEGFLAALWPEETGGDVQSSIEASHAAHLRSLADLEAWLEACGGPAR